MSVLDAAPVPVDSCRGAPPGCSPGGLLAMRQSRAREPPVLLLLLLTPAVGTKGLRNCSSSHRPGDPARRLPDGIAGPRCGVLGIPGASPPPAPTQSHSASRSTVAVSAANCDSSFPVSIRHDDSAIFLCRRLSLRAMIAPAATPSTSAAPTESAMLAEPGNHRHRRQRFPRPGRRAAEALESEQAR